MMNLSVLSNKKLCVAVSGGVDSVSLLHYLKAQEKNFGYILSAVHCEHGIRGEESLADAEFTKQLCQEWDVPLSMYREDCPARAKRDKESLETAARNFRLEVFSSILNAGKADFIATAHHKNDDAETVLFRLARGTSLSGVGGMSVMNEKIVRPFLGWNKAEILVYAKENGLCWREDRTNAELDATRNKLRAVALPALEKAVPGAIRNLVRFASIAKEDDELLYEMAKELVLEEKEGVFVAFSDKKPLFRRACLLALKKLGVEKDYTSLHLENAYALQFLHRGAKQNFPNGVEAVRKEKGLLFYKVEEKTWTKNEEVPFHENGFDGGRYEVNCFLTPIEERNEWKVLRADRDKIPPTAVFRFRKEGDYITSFGGGTKSLKKFFNEKKVAVDAREYLPLIAEKNGGEVYAVCGVEISERLKVTADTKKTLYITINTKEKSKEKYNDGQKNE